MSTFLNMVEMIFVENVYFFGLAFLQRDWKMFATCANALQVFSVDKGLFSSVGRACAP